MINASMEIKRAIAELDDMGRNQVPFAMSRAINDTVVEGQGEAQKGMQRDLKDPPTPWTQRGIRYRLSSKNRLQGALYILPDRWEYLQYVIEGGTRRPKREWIMIGLGRKNRYGNIPGWRQKRTRLLAKSDHFEGEVRGVMGIWQRRRRGLKLIVAFRKQITHQPRWRFFRRAERHADARLPIFFRRRLEEALESAR